eukprot:g3436.t1
MPETDLWDQFVQENWAPVLEGFYGPDWRRNHPEDVSAILWLPMAQRLKSGSDPLLMPPPGSDHDSPLEISTLASGALMFGSFQPQSMEGVEEEKEAVESHSEAHSSHELLSSGRVPYHEEESLMLSPGQSPQMLPNSKSHGQKWNIQKMDFHPSWEKRDLHSFPSTEMEDLNVHGDEIFRAFLQQQSEQMAIKTPTSINRESRPERIKAKRSGTNKRHGEELAAIDPDRLENKQQQKIHPELTEGHSNTSKGTFVGSSYTGPSEFNSRGGSDPRNFQMDSPLSAVFHGYPFRGSGSPNGALSVNAFPSQSISLPSKHRYPPGSGIPSRRAIVDRQIEANLQLEAEERQKNSMRVFSSDTSTKLGKSMKKSSRASHNSTSLVYPSDPNVVMEDSEDGLSSTKLSNLSPKQSRNRLDKDMERSSGLKSLLQSTPPVSGVFLNRHGKDLSSNGGPHREKLMSTVTTIGHQGSPAMRPHPSQEQLPSYCIDARPIIDRMDSHGRYPIHIATMAGRVEVVEQLLNHHCDPTKVLPVDLLPPHTGDLSMVWRDKKSADLDIKEIKKFRHELESNKTSYREHCWQDIVYRDPLIDQPSLKRCNALHLAAFFGHSTVLDLLLCRTSIDLNSTNDHRCTALHLAANKGHKHIVSRLLMSQECEIEAKDSQGRCPLHHAAAQGRSDVVDILWTKGCEIDAVDAQDWTALHYAAQAGHVDVVSKLIIAGCPVSKYDNSGFTPGHIAAFLGFASILEKVIHAGFDPDMQGGLTGLRGSCGSTALHMAASRGHAKVVELLLSEGAYANKKDHRGLSPLQCSAEGGHLEAFNILLEAGCNPQTTDTYGTTLLHSAASGGNWDIVRELIDLGCDHTTQSNFGRTALHHAAQVGAVQVSENLLRLGCDIHVADNEGNMPWHAAASGGNLKVLELFLNRGCNIEAVNSNAYTALHKAAATGSVSAVKALLKRGANIRALTSKRQTPLHLAAEQLRDEVLTLLIEEVDSKIINLKDENGRTILHQVAVQENGRLLKLLIERGADVNSIDKEGQTPLHYATKSHCQMTVETLLQCGCDVTAKDINSCTALHFAAQKNSASIFNLLFPEMCYTVSEKDKRGFCLLHYAVEGGNPEIVGRLLHRGESGNSGKSPKTELCLGAAQYDHIQGSEDIVNALHVACELGHIIVIPHLIKAGYHVQGRGPDGMEPIHFASGASSKDNVLWHQEDFEKHGKIVERLITEGADPNVVDKSGRNCLMYAAGVGDYDLVMKYLKLRVDHKRVDNLNAGPMHWAAHSGNPEIIKQFIKEGVPVDSKDKRGRLPLHRAAERGLLTAVCILVEAMGKQKSDIHKKDSKGYSPVQLAAAHGFVDVVTKLLEGGNTKDIKGLTALHLGIRMQMDDIVKSLLMSGKCDVNAKDGDGCTALHYAAESGQGTQVGMLLEAKADMFIASSDGMMPIHRAAAEGHMEVLEELIAHGALSNCTTTSGSTPLHYAASSGQLSVMRHLIRKKIPVNQMSSGTVACTALYCAASNGKLDAVNLLLEHDADVDVVCGNESTALHIAASNGHTAIVKRLLKAGTDVDFQAANGTAAIHNAVTNGHLETTEALIAADCDVDIQNSSGNTPLHIASCKGSLELSQVLLDANCDVHIKNAKGHQAVHSAASNGFLDIVLLLVQNGAPCKQKGDLDVAKMLCRKSSSLMASYVEGRLRLAERAKHRKAKPMESSGSHPTEEEFKEMQAQADAVMAELLAEEEKEKKAGDHQQNTRSKGKRNKDKKKRNQSLTESCNKAPQSKSKDPMKSPEKTEEDTTQSEKGEEEDKVEMLESLVMRGSSNRRGNPLKVFTEVKPKSVNSDTKQRRKESKSQSKSRQSVTKPPLDAKSTTTGDLKQTGGAETKPETETKVNSVTVIRRRSQPQVLVKSSSEDFRQFTSLQELPPKDTSIQVLPSKKAVQTTSNLARSISVPEHEKIHTKTEHKRSLTMAAVEESSGASEKKSSDSSHVWADAVKSALEKKPESKSESSSKPVTTSVAKKAPRAERADDPKIKVVNVSSKRKAFLPFSDKSISIEKSSNWTNKQNTMSNSMESNDHGTEIQKPSPAEIHEEVKTEKEPVLKWVTKELPVPTSTEQKQDLKGARVVPLTQKMKKLNLNSESVESTTTTTTSITTETKPDSKEKEPVTSKPPPSTTTSPWKKTSIPEQQDCIPVRQDSSWLGPTGSADGSWKAGECSVESTGFPFPGRSEQWFQKDYSYFRSTTTTATTQLQSSESWTFSSTTAPDGGCESNEQLDFQHLLPPELKDEITNGGATSNHFRTKDAAVSMPMTSHEQTMMDPESTVYPSLPSQGSPTWTGGDLKGLYVSSTTGFGFSNGPSSPSSRSNPLLSRIPDDPWEIDEIELATIFKKPTNSEEQSTSPEMPQHDGLVVQNRGVPFLCPLSHRPITDPVVGEDGITYDRASIQGNPHGFYHPYLAYSNGTSFS